MLYHSEQAVNDFNMTGITFFKINGLFGRRDICLDFTKQVNIYIGENGLGKTTILNCLYYVLTKQFPKLESINFYSIEIGFTQSNKQFIIKKADVVEYNHRGHRDRKYYGDMYFDMILNNLGLHSEEIQDLSLEKLDRLAMIISDQESISPTMVRKNLLRYIDLSRAKEYGKQNKGDQTKVTSLINAINENVKARIIYLPTYRRIENDFRNSDIAIDSLTKTDMLIRFGMADVQKSIQDILDKIKEIAMNGYSEMTGVLLNQYIKGVTVSKECNDNIDIDVVRIVLDRLGGKIEKQTRNDIVRMVQSKQIYQEKQKYLLNLLRHLIENYGDQKHYDDRINGFVHTCNKYLNDKYFYYDPSNLTLQILVNNGKSKPYNVALTQLSSGEKQIISLFSKLYLETEEKNIIIIDEPELSLSLTWQKMLLPDVMNSQSCGLLITVTHSPFIFDNEFDYDAREIRSCEI